MTATGHGDEGHYMAQEPCRSPDIVIQLGLAVRQVQLALDPATVDGAIDELARLVWVERCQMSALEVDEVRGFSSTLRSWAAALQTIAAISEEPQTPEPRI